MPTSPPPVDPTPDAPAEQIEDLLVRGDLAEREASAAFLRDSRPSLVGDRTLAWDGFWKRVAGGLDSLLWSWLGGEVDVARAQEDQRARQRLRPSKPSASEVTPPAPIPPPAPHE